METQQPEQFSFDFNTETAQIAAGSGDELRLQMGEFAGPLDLLLFLIRQEQANIFDIPIAKITDEYVRYIRLMKRLDISVAADFLVMAATLIEIKSKMLLPREVSTEAEDEIEDPRKELVDRLLAPSREAGPIDRPLVTADLEPLVDPVRFDDEDQVRVQGWLRDAHAVRLSALLRWVRTQRSSASARLRSAAAPQPRIRSRRPRSVPVPTPMICRLRSVNCRMLRGRFR